MKYRIICLWLALAIPLCLLATGCQDTPTEKQPTGTDVNSVIANPTDHPDQIIVSVPADEYWTWSHLYDFLESPGENSGWTVAEGDYFVLYAPDRTTRITKWDTLLEADMMAIQFDGEDRERYRFFIKLSGSSVTSAPDASTPAVSQGAVSSQGSTSSAPSAPAASVPAAKTMITLLAPTGDNGLKQAVADFNKRSQTVQVELIQADELMTATKLAGSLAAGTNPDLMVMDRREITLAAEDGSLRDLSKLGMDRWEPLFDATCWDKISATAKQYSVPIGCVTACLARNDDIVYSCGIKDLPTTYAQLVEQATAVGNTLTGITPMGFVTDPSDASSMVEEFALALWSFGGDLLTMDNLSAAFYSAEGMQAVSQLQTLNQQGLLGQQVTRKDFFAKTTAFAVVTSRDYEETFGKQAKANYTPLPLLTPGETAASFLDVYGFALAANTTVAKQNGIYEFLSFYLSSPGYSLTTCAQQGWIPALLSARNDQTYQTDAWQILIQAIPTARTLPAVEGYQTVDHYIADALADVLAGTDPETALSAAAEKTDNRLNRE